MNLSRRTRCLPVCSNKLFELLNGARDLLLLHSQRPESILSLAVNQVCLTTDAFCGFMFTRCRQMFCGTQQVFDGSQLGGSRGPF